MKEGQNYPQWKLIYHYEGFYNGYSVEGRQRKGLFYDR